VGSGTRAVASTQGTSQSAPLAIERVVLEGDLSVLSPAERLAYYRRVCDSLGLNFYTKPFEYLRLNGRLVLYATRAAADQLRKIHGISIEIVDQRLEEDGLYIVHVRARDKDGRVDEEVGVVPLTGLRGEALANAVMKAITKAKRRVTLSIAGLGWLDETEVDSIPEAQVVPMEEAMPVSEGRPAAPEPKAQPRVDWSGWSDEDRRALVDAMKRVEMKPRALLDLLYVDEETMAMVEDDPGLWPQVVLGCLPTVGGMEGLLKLIEGYRSDVPEGEES